MLPNLQSTPSRKVLVLKPVLAAVFGLAAGMLFVLFTQSSPLFAFKALMTAGFGCQAPGNCALLTTLQWATPLILSGLSAAVAFRAGIFCIGQAGQMVLGAAMAAQLGSQLHLPAALQITLALAGAAAVGALWGIIPGLLKVHLNVNEIISSFVMNQAALFFLFLFRTGRIPPAARLLPLAVGTKLNGGFLIALACLLVVFLLLFRATHGFGWRMSGQAPHFAHFGGIHTARSVTLAMCLSGALAGLAGGIEVLGVHYRFVSSFSENPFDGVIVALMGQSHPLGILLSGVFLGGVRLGSLNGLQLEAGIPRELGGAMIAIMVLLMTADRLYHLLRQRTRHLKNRLNNSNP